MFTRKPDHFSVKLSERSIKRLDQLTELSGSESRDECLRNAMRLLDQCIEWTEAGNTFALITAKGDVVPVTIFAAPPPTGRPKFQVIDGGKKAD